MAQISYTNKVALNENPEIANINKVTDDDMNEIKQVVNNNYNNTIIISDTQPTSEDNKIWIDTGEVQNLGSEVHIGDTINSKIGLNILIGKNLIDLSSMLISGGYSDTGYVASTNYITIQYVQVRPNTTYTLSTNLSTSKYTVLRIVDFDNNKTFIRRSGGTALASSNTFTTSSDAYYLALCFYTGQTASISDITQAQCEKGSTATTYQPYITPTINVDGEDIYSKSKVLWINPSSTSAFASQNITLSSGDYDYLEVFYIRHKNQQIASSIKVPKGSTFNIKDFATSNNAYAWLRDRTFTYTDDTHYAIGVNYLQFTNSNTRTEENDGLIPQKIIGYKE